MILPGSEPASIAHCVQALRAGELVALPTETVYGLAADADNDAAVARIFAIKGRPSDHPLIVHVDASDRGAAGAAHFAASLPAFAQALIEAFWPGPLTLIVPRRATAGRAAAGGHATVGLRCPSHPVAQALLKACHASGVVGLAAPSANRFGRVSPTTAAHVQDEFGAEHPALPILDGGACSVGIESTIVDCTRAQPVLLRPGAITPQQMREACGLEVISVEEALARLSDTATPKASGTLEAHYAPRARLRLMDTAALRTALRMLGSDVAGATPVIGTYARTILRSASSGVVSRRMPDDAQAAAQQLFAVLRGFDDLGVKLIWVESPPEGAEWDGVRDRLRRAAASD